MTVNEKIAQKEVCCYIKYLKYDLMQLKKLKQCSNFKSRRSFQITFVGRVTITNGQ